jgi:hypothetical protein
MTVKRASIVALALGASAACGGGDSLPTGPSPVTAEVEFQYVLAEGQASSLASELPCAGEVRLRPSFWGFSHVTMISLGARSWGARFEEIPVGRHSVRVTAPEACARGQLSANGVLLSDILDGGSALSFTLHPDGSVEP